MLERLKLTSFSITFQCLGVYAQKSNFKGKLIRSMTWKFYTRHKIGEQAGQSRATLDISSEFSSNFPLRTHKSRSMQGLLRYSTLNILMSSYIGGCLHLKDLYNIIWSYKIKFKFE